MSGDKGNLYEKPCIDVAGLAAETLSYAIESCPRPDGTKPSVEDPDFMQAVARYVTLWSIEYFRSLTSEKMAAYLRGLTMLPIDDVNLYRITENVAETNGLQPVALGQILQNMFNAMLCNGILREINNGAIALNESERARKEGWLN